MAAVSQKIPNLLGGVSQQPDPVKLPGQVKEAVNVYLDPTFGCRKRPSTEYIATLASDIPATAKWFPILRDNDERYAVAIYRDTNDDLFVRVFDMNDGQERTVNVSSTAEAYLVGANPSELNVLSVSDYTFITNPYRVVSMSGNETAELSHDALVVVEQVAYNTTYSVDFQKDGTSSPVVIYRAKNIEVSPSTYEVSDGGLCSDVDAQNFSISSGGKTGLQFRLVNQCAAYLKNRGEKTRTRVKEVEVIYAPPNILTLDPEETSVSTTIADGLKITVKQTLTYDKPLKSFQLPERAVRVKNPSPVSSDDQFLFVKEVTTSIGPTRKRYYYLYRAATVEDSPVNEYGVGDVITANNGVKVRVTKLDRQTVYNEGKYMSRYTVSSILQNGGSGWRVGDEVTAVLNGQTFTVRVTEEEYVYAYASGGSASFTTPADASSGTLDIGAVVTGLASSINALPDYTAASVGNVIKVTSAAGRDFNISARGGTVNRAMSVVKGFVNDISRLPTQGWDGYIVKVANVDDTTSDDYYVRFTTESPGVPGGGNWEETVAPNTRTTINSATMPHVLVREADGSFSFDSLNSSSAFGGWAPRQVGDEVSNPDPSFIGRTISSLFFYANRLGFLSEDAVVLSQPGDYFNFFINSALTISDGDPIDLTASSTKPAILKAAIGTPKGLILFAERSQFLLSTSEVAFSASTVKLTEVSEYFYRSDVQPLSTGVSIAFLSSNTTYSKVLEMAKDSLQDGNRPTVADITRIVPEYLPSTISWAETLPNSDMLVYGDNSRDVYVFKFFNNGDERQMAGWARWRYPASVFMFASEDDRCHIVLFDGTRSILVNSELNDDPDDAPIDVGFSSFTPRLDITFGKDLITAVPEGVHRTRITLPEEHRSLDAIPVFVVTDGDSRATFRRPEVEIDANTGVWSFVVDNELTASSYVVGLEYEARVTLPSFFLTQENRADRVNIPMVENLYLDLYYSGRYEVEISKTGYTTYTQSLEVTAANIYNATTAPLTEISTLSVPIFSRGDIVTVTVKAPDPFPSSITGYSWEGHYNNRGISPIR